MLSTAYSRDATTRSDTLALCNAQTFTAAHLMGRPLIRSETRTRARTTITDMVCPEDPAYKVAKLADKLPQVLSFFIKKSFCEVFFSDAILLVVPYVNFFQKGILKSLRAPLQKLVHFPSRFATQIDRMHDAGPPAPGRRRVAMVLELSGAGLLRGAFGSGSPAAGAGEAGDGFDLPRRSARTAEGITTKSPARSG